MNPTGCEPRERLRKPKFTPDQIRVLIERVVAHGPQLYGEKVSPVSVRKRIWQEVTRAINEISHTERSVIEVQKRWQDERRRIKHRAQDLWRALAETGEPMGQLTPLEQAVMTTFDESVVKEPVVASAAIRQASPAVPLCVQLHQCTAGVSPMEEPFVSQNGTPISSPTLTPAPAACVSVEDIKQERSDPECPAGVDNTPQHWRFEWTAESPRDPSVPPPAAALKGLGTKPSASTTTIRTTPTKQLRSQNSALRRKRLRQQQWQTTDRRWAALTACLRSVASGAVGLRKEVRDLSANMLALRSELGALVGAVTAVASALQDRHSNGQVPPHSKMAGDSRDTPTSPPTSQM